MRCARQLSASFKIAVGASSLPLLLCDCVLPSLLCVCAPRIRVLSRYARFFYMCARVWWWCDVSVLSSLLRLSRLVFGLGVGRCGRGVCPFSVACPCCCSRSWLLVGLRPWLAVFPRLLCGVFVFLACLVAGCQAASHLSSRSVSFPLSIFLLYHIIMVLCYLFFGFFWFLGRLASVAVLPLREPRVIYLLATLAPTHHPKSS